MIRRSLRSLGLLFAFSLAGALGCSGATPHEASEDSAAALDTNTFDEGADPKQIKSIRDLNPQTLSVDPLRILLPAADVKRSMEQALLEELIAADLHREKWDLDNPSVTVDLTSDGFVQVTAKGDARVHACASPICVARGELIVTVRTHVAIEDWILVARDTTSSVRSNDALLNLAAQLARGDLAAQLDEAIKKALAKYNGTSLRSGLQPVLRMRLPATATVDASISDAGILIAVDGQ